MSSQEQPHCKESIRERHRKRSDAGATKPLYGESRKVIAVGNSLAVGVTSYARKTHSVKKGDEVQIETYPEGIWISLEAADE